MRDPILNILFEDADVIVVEKPAGLAVIPGRAESDSLIERLGRQLDVPSSGTIDPRLRIVHRLDKDTSGVLLLAKHIGAQRALSEQFQNNLVKKEYLALVAGTAKENEGEIDAPLGPHPTSPTRRIITSHGGRPARTLWRIEKRLGPLTLLRVFPQTGKTHQIRVHLSHIGLPLAIDPLYNPRANVDGIRLSHFKRGYRATKDEPERPLIDRLTLHAEKLTFAHPKDGQAMTVECPLPKPFRATLQTLAKYAT